MGWINEHYISTGKVRYIYRHLATRGQEAIRSAEASECAAEQDQFWAYHDNLFADQVSKGTTLNDDILLQMASDLQLDMTAFESCLNSGRYAEQLQQEADQIQKMGIRATPGFVINGALLIGAQPYEAFSELINSKLVELGLETAAEQQSTAVREIEELTIFPPQPVSAEIRSGKWQNCGIYNAEVPIDNVLSSMARGAVWISYQPDLLTDEQINQLRSQVETALAKTDQPRIILSPGAYSEAPVMVTAWRVQLPLQDPADPRLAEFLDQFKVGPFAPEAGQPCVGGVGEPVG